MTRDPAERHCATQDPDLFTSTAIADHEQAASFCADCPAFTWCARKRDEFLASIWGLGMDGTWAGELFRDGRKVTTSKVCHACGRRARRKGSWYCSRDCGGDAGRDRRKRAVA